MTRLSDDASISVQDLTDAMLHSAASDEPPPGTLERTAKAMGVIGVLASSATVAPAAQAGQVAVGVAAAGSTNGKVVVLSAVAKWFGTGFVGTSLAVGAVSAVVPETRTAPPHVAVQSEPKNAQGRASGPSTRGAERGETEAQAAENAPVEPAMLPGRAITPPPARPHRASANPAMRSRRPSASSTELELLVSARDALRSGKPLEARRLLGLHEQRFGAGVFADERSMLLARTLIALGRSEEAATLAREFLRLHPGSLHAQRMRNLLKAHDDHALQR